MKNYRNLGVWVLLTLLFSVVGCAMAKPLSEERASFLYSKSVTLTKALQSQDYPTGFDIMSRKMQEALPKEAFVTIILDLEAKYGTLKSYEQCSGSIEDGYDIIEMILVFEKASVVQRVVFDTEVEVTGLWLRNHDSAHHRLPLAAVKVQNLARKLEAARVLYLKTLSIS
jgi:hypothetical protein